MSCGGNPFARIPPRGLEAVKQLLGNGDPKTDTIDAQRDVLHALALRVHAKVTSCYFCPTKVKLSAAITKCL